MYLVRSQHHLNRGDIVVQNGTRHAWRKQRHEACHDVVLSKWRKRVTARTTLRDLTPQFWDVEHLEKKAALESAVEELELLREQLDKENLATR